MKKVYLDNAATTKMADEVVKAMNPYFSDKFGNASCLHSFGQEARDAVENARKIIADKINAEPEEIIFTSGGSESNNLAIKGIAYELKGRGNHIITSKFEHPAVLNVSKELEKQGFKISYLNVSRDGFIDLEQLKQSITKQTILVSLMHANNEIGTVQDIEKIGRICKEQNVLFHTDAVQSFAKVGIDVKKANLSLASFSAHKLHGPKGIGALYVKKGITIKKQIHGGSQEFNQRAGTENVSGIVGFAKAVELMKEKDIEKMNTLRDYFIEELLKFDGTSLNGSKENRLCNNISVSFKNVEGESVLLALDDKGIAVSTSSACTSAKLEPSHVLKAIGLKPEDSHGTIRFTLSKYTSKDDVDYTLNSLKYVIKKLRGISPE
ncbi:cysteine desulfurase [Candidatus Woesearchaeota archaeon]|nr:cysteine desulfurase [Candidatus Woesearchaeota archaeon]